MPQPGFHEDERSLTLSNGNTDIQFTRDGRLVSLRHREPDFGFPIVAPDGSPGGPLWQVVLRASDGKCTVVEPSGRFSYDAEPRGDSVGLRLRWNAQVDGHPLEVCVSVALGADRDASAWRAAVQYDGPLAVWEVVCPRLAQLGPIEGDGSDDLFAMPWLYGGIIPDPMDLLAQGGSRGFAFDQDYGAYDTEQAIGRADSKIAYSYPGMWAMQFMAYYNSKQGGLYVGREWGRVLILHSPRTTCILRSGNGSHSLAYREPTGLVPPARSARPTTPHPHVCCTGGAP